VLLCLGVKLISMLCTSSQIWQLSSTKSSRANLRSIMAAPAAASFNYRERPHKALFDDLLVKFDPHSCIGGQSPRVVFEMKFRPGESGAQYGGK